MKALSLFFGIRLQSLALAAGLSGLCAEAGDGYGSAWENETEICVDALKQSPTDENIVRLCDQLKIAAHHKPDTLERWRSIERVVNTLLDVPNVQRRLVADLEARRRLAPNASSEYRFTYEPWRYTLLTYVLPYFKTPETVIVLGGFLDDMRDQHPIQDGGRTPPPPENAYFALAGLMRMNLNSPPFFGESPPFGSNSPWSLKLVPEFEGALPAFRDWFREVQAGETSFSFKDSEYQYRLSSDGAWQRVVKGASKVSRIHAVQIKEGLEREGVPSSETEESEQTIKVWYFVVGLVGIVGIGFWLIRKSQRTKGRA